MVLSDELQQKLDEITPKLTFVNCVAAVAKAAMFYKDFEAYRQALNNMTHEEQQKLADEWEAKKFTSSNAFCEWLREQPYFLKVRETLDNE